MIKKGRNDKCSCGSGKKYKYCCLEKEAKEKSEELKSERLSMYEEFMEIEDPRDNRGKEYKLIDVMVLIIYGILNGYTDFTNMADFLNMPNNKQYFKMLLNISKIPSHDCFSDLFAVIKPKEFMRVFVKWASKMVKNKYGMTLAIDGKAVKSATDKINGGNVPYIVSGFLSGLGFSIGQVKVNKKSNEITAIPELLNLINIKNLIITMDAMGTHEKIANQIVANEGHYILKVKGNQEELMDNIKTYFDLEKDGFTTFETGYEKDHGRIEKRKYFLSYDIEGISDKEKWKTVKAIGKIIVYRDNGTKVTKEEQYFIIDHCISLNLFVKATRNHWNIECGLHWRLDVIFDEDHCTSRRKYSIENLAALRKVVFNLVRLDPSFGDKIPLQRKLTRYRMDYKNIEKLIFDILPGLTI